MANREKFVHTTHGGRLIIMAACLRTFRDGARWFCQAWDVQAYGADYSALEGRGDTKAEAVNEFWRIIAGIKQHRTSDANTAGTSVDDLSGA